MNCYYSAEFIGRWRTELTAVLDLCNGRSGQKTQMPCSLRNCLTGSLTSPVAYCSKTSVALRRWDGATTVSKAQAAPIHRVVDLFTQLGSMKIDKKSARKRAVSALEAITKDTSSGSSHTERTALHALDVAIESSDRILEAEAMLQLTRTGAPILNPERALAFLDRAATLFLANKLQVRAASCVAASARALYDLGRERDAIAATRIALNDQMLPPSERIGALIICALAHGHLGELDIALQILNTEVAPVVRATETASLRAHATRALGLTHLQVLIAREKPTLWRGPTRMPTIVEASPSVATIVKLLQEAHALDPQGQHSGYALVGAEVASQLFGGAKPAAGRLSFLAKTHRAADPAMAGWAYFCEGIIHRDRGDVGRALSNFTDAIEVGTPHGMTALIRDSLLQQSRACESIGDMDAALETYKRYADLRLLSVVCAYKSPLTRSAVRLSEEFVDIPALAAEAVHRPHNLDSVHVRRALRFIDHRSGDNISVEEVARHCKISRRTLEVAFKECRSTTVSKYIKLKKLEIAERAIRDTNDSIEVIASMVGYGSAATLGRDFQRAFNMSPSTYRRKNL